MRILAETVIEHEVCWIFQTASAQEIQLALVPDRQYANYALLGQKAIERDIAGLSVGNDQLAYFTFDAPTDQRVIRKNLDGFTNSNSRIPCCRRIVRCQKRECPLQISERILCVDYLRHALGRAAFGLRARRSSQACTSSAR